MQNQLIFKTVPDLIKDNKFALVDCNVGNHFSGSDQVELFKDNLIKQPSDWYYRTHPVHYTLNSRGYRTQEFDDIDWANSIVMFGCSNTFGVGLDDKDTISTKLSEMIGIPVINMGIGGSSIQISLHNSIILRDKYPLPKGVIHMWSDYSRTVYYNKRRIRNLGPWSVMKDGNVNRYLKEWVDDDSHGKSHALLASKTSKLLWGGTKYYECTYFDTTASLLGCKKLKFKDYARDLRHPGIISSTNAASIITRHLNL
jgi:hypothetical protein